MKNFLKAIQKNYTSFQYLETKFRRDSDAKLKKMIFIGP